MLLTRLSATLVAVVLLAGCGEERAQAPKIQTKADFIAAADKICVERDTRGRNLARQPRNDIGHLTGELAKAYDTAISKSEALALPPGAGRAGAQKYVRSLAAMRRPVQRMKSSAAALEAATDVAVLKRTGARLAMDVNTVQAVADLADQNARLYGMKRCGQQQALPPVT